MSYSPKSKVLQIFSILCLIALSSSVCLAQDIKYSDYDWDKVVKPYALPDSLKDADAVYLKMYRFYEFNPEMETQKNVHYVEHIRTYLNSDKAIERNNKIYIQEGDDIKILEHKIRIIQPNGDVVVLDEKSIKKGTDEESGTEYSYYAVEGLKIGSEIESLNVFLTEPHLYGSINYLEKSYPVTDFKFEHISPNFLEFAFKIYNSNLKGETSEEDDKIIYKLYADYIPKLDPEPNSYVKANSQYFIYKLDRNHTKNLNDINGFGFYSQAIGERALNVELSKSERKKLDKIFKEIAIKGEDAKENALLIEGYIKNNFAFVNAFGNPELQTMDKILKNRAFNNWGATQVYRYFLNKANIDCGVILTCNKENIYFDEEFENYLFLNKYLLSLKDLNSLIDPSDEYSRGLNISTNYQDCKGLFIQSKSIGKINTAIGKVKTIPYTSAEENLYRIDLKVAIENNFDDIIIHAKSERRGLVAKTFQPLFSQVEKNKLEQFYEYALHTYDKQYIPSTVKFENVGADDFPTKPLIANFDISNEDFWEKGGNTYIFNLGLLIGPQSQMYYDDQKERKNSVHSTYAREYRYTIEFNIPENLQVTNLDEINFDEVGSMEGMEYFFKSSYTQEGDKVIVTIHEHYDRMSYPASHFKNYQKVINAAADFNKVKLLFKPK